MASRPVRLKRLLIQLTPAALRDLRAEQRRTGSASRAEVIRGLIADGFTYRALIDNAASPDSDATKP